jgi:uncharacterized protein YcbK (DUF882 family)
MLTSAPTFGAYRRNVDETPGWNRSFLAYRTSTTYFERMPDKLTFEMRRDRSAARGNRAGLRRRELLLATGVGILLSGTAFARPEEPRRLTLKNMHTGETFTGPYRDGTGPLPAAVSDLAVFLRDFHADKTGPVDIAMLDFLADVMAATNQGQATVLSAYRTRETNERLMATTFGVAEHSQHIVGRAIDVTFDSNLGGVEKAALAMKRGGVGWYPSSHFIHLDSGPVRSWKLDGADFEQLLMARDLSAPPRGILTVRQRMARLRALAHQEMLLRR